MTGHTMSNPKYAQWLRTLETNQIAKAIVDGLLDSVDDYLEGVELEERDYAQDIFEEHMKEALWAIDSDIVGRIGAAYGLNKSFEEYCIE